MSWEGIDDRKKRWLLNHQTKGPNKVVTLQLN